MIVTLKPSETLIVEFFECDGQFQIHFDTLKHPQRIVVKETANLPGSIKGTGGEILYEEHFGKPPRLKSQEIPKDG